MRIRLRAPRSKARWIALLFGLGMAASCVIPLARGVLSLSWPKVDGVITHSEDRVIARRTTVDIRFRYSVGGASYTAGRFRFQYPLVSFEGRDADIIVGRYRPGEPVKVSVNPADPADAVLEAGPDIESLIPLGAGLFLILLGIGDLETADPTPAPAPVGPRYRTAKILTVIGAAMVVFGAWELYRGVNSTTWPATPGKILYSQTRTGSPENLLWYEYFVDNRRYLASTYRNGGNATPFRKVAEEAGKRYPTGKTVSVYYDPGNPSNALLEPGVWYGNFVIPGIGLIVLLAAWVAKRLAEVTAASRARHG